ncbi:hypothetical protein [Piscibacillus salipiscarius]|uniref:hypothetical protein n=1 Tax=Piscibacillus salipiscarius TaxID=299480 RepID=UPI0024366304|nr:hypothetical protein [Piscibacillus salipiscarius]
MDKHIWTGVKVLATIIFIIGVVMVSFAGIYTLMTVSTGRNLMAALIILVALGIIVFWILGVFNLVKLKKLVISMAVYFGICLLIFVGQLGYAYYLDSLEVVSTQDVDLSEYKPFANDTKAVSSMKNQRYKLKMICQFWTGQQRFTRYILVLLEWFIPKKIMHYITVKSWLIKRLGPIKIF